MKKLSRLSFLFAAIIMLAQVFLPTLSYAVLYHTNGEYNTGDSVTLSAKTGRPDVYKIGDQYVIKIEKNGEDDSYYCLRGGRGFGHDSNALGSNITYLYRANLLEKSNVLNRLNYLSDASYESICKIADNMYIPSANNAADTKNNLLAKAGIIGDMSDVDIDVVQQVALWYYTNADKADDIIAQYVINLDQNDPNNDPLGLSVLKINDNHYSNEEDAIFNYNRATKINKLYRYFIETIQSENYLTDEKIEIPEFKIEEGNTEPEIKKTMTAGSHIFLIGPFKVNKVKEGNVDYSAEFKCTVDGVEFEINPSDDTVGLVENKDQEGVLTSKEAINADEFYVRIFRDDLDIGEISNFKLDLAYTYEYDKTIATVWTAETDEDNQQPVLKVEKEQINGNDSDSFEIDLNVSGSYNLTLVKEDANGEELTTAKFKIAEGTDNVDNAPEITVPGELIIAENKEITDINTPDIYTIKETQAPDEYCEFDGVIKIEVYKEKVGNKYQVKEVKYYVDDVQVTENREDLDVFLNTDGNIFVTVKDYQFDLALRKFIYSINGDILTGENSREPKVYTNTLKNGRDGEYTATYVHPKNVLTLQRGDKITYKIRIYNEGEIAGTATEVTDYLPEGLIFVANDPVNQAYGWSAEGQKVTTNYLGANNIIIPAYDKDEGRPELPANSKVQWQQAAEGTSDGIYYVDLPIVCQISETVEAGKILRNIAEIKNDDGDDRDSTPGNVDRDNYNPGDDNSTYQEDDDDYERVKVEEFFDLALRKYISSVRTGGVTTTFEEEGTRNPNDDTSKLNVGDRTTADYKHQKDPVVVETGSLVNYKLVIYNEGDVAGRATKVIDQLPEGLKFKQIISGNFELDGTNGYNETTNTLTLVRMERNEDNLAPYNGTTLASETIEIQCEVIATPEEDDEKILTNIAWIAEYFNEKGLEDRDSDANNTDVPDELVTVDTGYINEEKNSGKELDNPESYFEGQEDDDDFEKVVLKPINGKYDIVLVKEDAQGEQLNETATFEVDGVEKQVTGRLTIVKDKKITSTNLDTVDTYIIKETVPPDKYCAFDGEIKIEVYKKKDGQKYVVDYIKYYVDDVQVTENREDLDVYLNTDGNIYVEVKDYQFDLALRKFISKIERKNQNIDFDSRVPEIDTSKLNTIDEETGKKITTARYIHPKEALTVKQGDIITYTLRVYNEGELDGYAKEIEDYLPSGLGFLMGYEGNEFWKVTSENFETKTIDGLENVTVVYAKDGEKLALANSSLKDELIKKYGTEAQEDDLWQQSINSKDDGLFYQEVEITCIVLAPNTFEGELKNIAEISQDKAQDDFGTEITIDDRDSEVENVWDDDEHKPGKEDNGYTPGEQDDDDFEPVRLGYFDLALRKFITGVNEENVTSRIPEFTGKIDEYGNYIYDHPKDPVYVIDKDIVTYTIRIFNEGTIAGYAEEIEDDIPEGLIFLPDTELNKEYRWQMFRPVEDDEELDDKTTIVRNNKIYVETDDVEKATIIRTDYLSEAQGKIDEETGENNNLLKPFNKEAFDNKEINSPDYKDVLVQFKVSQSDIPEENTDKIIINKAHITEDSDDDEDSTPDKWKEHEDDQDIEKIYVKEFDLALFKWVEKTIVTVDGKTTETETGFIPNTGLTEQSGENYRENSEAEPIASVVIDKKKLNKTVVKFAYKIKVINEGDIEGYATEITDYIPEGLDFIAEDNPLWTIGEKDGTITTRALENVLLKPGESTVIPVVFTWKNDANNLGLKTNVAAITEDYNDKGVEDIDSTPGNEDRPNYEKEQEDDDDFALVILTLKTGTEFTYIGLILAIVAIISAGVVTIKKYVL